MIPFVVAAINWVVALMYPLLGFGVLGPIAGE